MTIADGRHRHCGAILQGTKAVTSSDHVMEIQFHSDEYDNTTQDFRHTKRLLKGVWLHFTAGMSSPLPASSLQRIIIMRFDGDWLTVFMCACAVPTEANVLVTCRRLNSDEPEVVEISRDDTATSAYVITPPAIKGLLRPMSHMQ